MYESEDKNWNSLFRNEKGCVYLLYLYTRWVVCSLLLASTPTRAGPVHDQLCKREPAGLGLKKWPLHPSHEPAKEMEVEWALKNRNVLEKHLGLCSTILLSVCTFPKQVLWSAGRTVHAYSGPLFLMVVGFPFLVGLFKSWFLDRTFTFAS